MQRSRLWLKHDGPSQTTPKSDIHEKKSFFSVWWDYKEIVHYGIKNGATKNLLFLITTMQVFIILSLPNKNLSELD